MPTSISVRIMPAPTTVSAITFPSTPANCFIVNDDVNGASVPDKLDRQFYIDMAKERAQGYGI